MREEGRKGGRKDGRKKGREEGSKEGRKEGRKEGGKILKDINVSMQEDKEEKEKKGGIKLVQE